MNFLLDNEPFSIVYSYYGGNNKVTESKLFRLKGKRVGMYGRVDPFLYSSEDVVFNQLEYARTPQEAVDKFIAKQEEEIKDLRETIAHAKKLKRKLARATQTGEVAE